MLGLQDVHLHDFRRTFATHLYMATKGEFLVKRCLNHTNPSVTAIYVRISYEEVSQAMQGQADRFFALMAGSVPLALPAPAQEALAPVAFC
jgi:integrase